MIKFGSTLVVSLLQAISKLNTISKAFQTLKTLTGFDCLVSSQQKIFTYFSVLRYIANFKGAELQFSRFLIGVHAKLLVDPTKMNP